LEHLNDFLNLLCCCATEWFGRQRAHYYYLRARNWLDRVHEVKEAHCVPRAWASLRLSSALIPKRGRAIPIGRRYR